MSVRSAVATIAPRPFAAPVAQMVIAERESLAELIACAVVSGHLSKAEALSPHLVVTVGGVEVPRTHWRQVRPRAGALVLVRIRPAGGRGGKNPLRMILQLLVVVAVAAISGGALAGALKIGGTALFTAGSTSAMLLAGVASLALNALVNAIAPIAQPEQRARSQTYAISGARNTADFYG